MSLSKWFVTQQWSISCLLTKKNLSLRNARQATLAFKPSCEAQTPATPKLDFLELALARIIHLLYMHAEGRGSKAFCSSNELFSWWRYNSWVKTRWAGLKLGNLLLIQIASCMARPEAGLVVFFYMYSNSRAYRADVKTVTHHTVHTSELWRQTWVLLSCDRHNTTVNVRHISSYMY